METAEKDLKSLSATKRALVALKKMRAEKDAQEKKYREPIAIIGMGCRFPGGANSPADFWQLLHKGVDAIDEIPTSRWNVESFYDGKMDTPGKMYIRHGGFLESIDGFDAKFFGISPREAASMDPQQRLLLEVCWEALENAHQPPDRLYGTSTGVFLGISSYDYGLRLVGSGDYDRIDTYFGTGNSLCVAAGRLSYILGLIGPCMSLDTACSSSLLAIHLACQSLRAGESEMAIAGGVNLILEPGVNISYCQAHMMARDGRCKTFDESADGYSRSDGCGVVILKRLSRALADGDPITAVVRGSAVNQDGPSGGLTVPSGPSQEKVLRQALANAAVKPHQIDYVEAHGTGTSLGDPIEVAALNAVYSQERDADQPLLIGSVKTNLGHLEAAAGMAGLIKVVLAMQHQEIPPHIHFSNPNPFIPWSEMNIEVAASNRSWPKKETPRLAGVSAFGFGGTNVHLVVEEPPATHKVETEMERPLHLVNLSAKGYQSLKMQAARYVDYLDKQPLAPLADIAYSANTGRAQFEHRLSVVAENIDSLRKRLSAFIEEKQPIGWQVGKTHSGSNNEIVFLFTGQGSQYPRMSAELYESQPTFRKTINRCDEILRSYLKKPLLEVLYSPNGENSALDDTEYTQPAIFAVEYALAELWKSWGVQPTAVMGHSMGEYVAACVAGVFTLENGLRLIAERGRLMASLGGDGAMATVFADEKKVREVLADYASQVSLAAINGPEIMVISGERSVVEVVLAEFTRQGLRTISLNISHAFHSPMTKKVVDAFMEVAAQIEFAAPQLKLLSNGSGEWAGDDIASPDYWGRHLQQPVQFLKSMQTLHRENYEIFLEIGPDPELLGLDQCLPEGYGADLSTPVAWLPSLRAGRSDWEQLLESLSTLWQRGVLVDWRGFDRDYSRRPIALPNYAFEHQHYWMISDTPSAVNNQQISSPMLTQLLAGDVDNVIENLTATGRFSTQEQALLPRVFDQLARQLRREITTANLDSWFYELTWLPQDTVVGEDTPLTTSRWLILAEQADSLADHLTSVIDGQNGQYVFVNAASEFVQTAADRYRLDFGDPSQVARLFSALNDGHPLGPIIYLADSGVQFNDNSQALPSGEVMLEASHHGCTRFLSLCQQLLHYSAAENPRLWVITRGALSLMDGVGPGGISQAPLWGMGKIFGLEHPDYWGGLVDVGMQPSLEDVANTVREINSHVTGEDQLYLHDGHRYVARLVASNVSTAAAPTPVKKDATYLITGGQGALGQRIAEWLVEQGARYLILTGRREPSQKVLATVERLKAAGAHTKCFQADVTDETAMGRCLAEIEMQLWPKLQGVIHVAGTVSFEMIKELGNESLHNILKAKVGGAWLLHKLTQDYPLDFFVCFSSIASVWGSVGQAHYAAANQFLDALAHYRHQQGRPALCVNWGPWEGGGMTTSEAQEWLDRMGVRGMAPDNTLEAFAVALANDIPQLVVADIDWSKFKAVYEARRRRPLLEAIEVATDSDAPSSKAADFLKELEEAPPLERQNMLTSLILQQLVKVLWLEESPNPSQGFFDLGMDSITVIQLMTGLKTYLGRTLAPTIAFEYPSAVRLAEHLLTDVLQLDMGASATQDQGPVAKALDDDAAFIGDIKNLGDGEIRDLIDSELMDVE